MQFPIHMHFSVSKFRIEVPVSYRRFWSKLQIEVSFELRNRISIRNFDAALWCGIWIQDTEKKLRYWFLIHVELPLVISHSRGAVATSSSSPDTGSASAYGSILRQPQERICSRGNYQNTEIQHPDWKCEAVALHGLQMGGDNIHIIKTCFFHELSAQFDP